MNVPNMSDKFKDRLRTIVKKIKLPKKIKAIVKFKGLLHFAEVKIFTVKGPAHPVAVITVDKPRPDSKYYFASETLFCSDFSRLKPEFLVDIQWLVKDINTKMK